MNSSSVQQFVLEFPSLVIKWFHAHGAAENVAAQLLAVLGLVLCAWLISRLIFAPMIDAKIRDSSDESVLKNYFLVTAKNVLTPFISLFFVWVVHGAATHFGHKFWWLHASRVFLAAWLLSRLVTSSIAFQFRMSPSKTLIIVISSTIWLIAGLEISHLLTPLTTLMVAITFNFAGLDISLLHIIEALIILFIFLWLGQTVTASFSGWIDTIPKLTPALRVLTEKTFKVVFYAVGFVAVLGGLGIDLSSLAWFSGAVGLGVGFGLQKVISNLASGFIMLVDRSVKPGDVIQLDEHTFGWINHLGGRYVSLITRDGIEHIIPNEDLITGRVVNWSYSHENVRVKVPIGIAYEADVELAMATLIEIARATPRVLSAPEPSCRLMEFADSSINLELRIWIADPKRGVASLRSEILLEVWRRFKERGIEIPFPQRVIHHRFPEKETPEELCEDQETPQGEQPKRQP
jgi:small-conductance mechanosensitive channel